MPLIKSVKTNTAFFMKVDLAIRENAGFYMKKPNGYVNPSKPVPSILCTVPVMVVMVLLIQNQSIRNCAYINTQNIKIILCCLFATSISCKPTYCATIRRRL